MRLRLKEPVDGSSLIFCGIEFQIVGAANLKALRPKALAVKGTCNRLSEAERRGLGCRKRCNNIMMMTMVDKYLATEMCEFNAFYNSVLHYL